MTQTSDHLALIDFNPGNPEHHRMAARLWGAACGPFYAISPAFVEYNTQPSNGYVQSGKLAITKDESGADQAAGFALASTQASGLASPLAWLDAIAVHPEHQRCGIGSALLDWATTWLGRRHCQIIQLGGGMRPFAPGLPQPSGAHPFFEKHGFQPPPENLYVWDMAHRLDQYVSPPMKSVPAEIRPVQDEEVSLLLDFLQREFPGRWHFECQEFFREGGRSTDYYLLHTAQGVAGFCATTREDSHRPLDRYYLHRLPHPWAQLGSIGITSGERGRGLGTMLIDAVLRQLKEQGVLGCVIDWTVLVDFYAKFGFIPYTQYLNLIQITGAAPP